MPKLTREQQFDKLWTSTEIPTLPIDGNKYVFISDMHLGDGGESDDFHENEMVLVTALQRYRQKGFKLVFIGDIEEFWQFDYQSIRERYDNTVYKEIQLFGKQNIYRIYGNHDYEWGGLVDPMLPSNGNSIAFPASEAVKLTDLNGVPRILVVHGHQGSKDSDKTSWFSRFAVRVFRYIEPIAIALGLYGHKSSTKSMIAKDFEKNVYEWAINKKIMIICGHTHRAIFASKSRIDILLEAICDKKNQMANFINDKEKYKQLNNEIEKMKRRIEDEKSKNRDIEPMVEDPSQLKPNYFNTGCCLYKDGITAIEMEDDQIRLVKWDNKTNLSECISQPNPCNLSVLFMRIQL